VAITPRTAKVTQNSSTQTINAALPDDFVAGDYVIAHVAFTSIVANLTPPAGWTQIVAPFISGIDTLAAAYGRSNPGAGPTVTTSSAVGRQTVICEAYGGVDTSTPTDGVTPTTGTNASTAPAVAQLTGTSANARLVSGIAANNSTAVFTAPSGMTLQAQTSGGGGRSGGYADEEFAAGGSTGTRTFGTNGAVAHSAYLFALRPAVDAGEPPTYRVARCNVRII